MNNDNSTTPQVCIVTGSSGLIGSESVKFFIEKGYTVVGIDNNMREFFFGEDASTKEVRNMLLDTYKKHYIHYNDDIRDENAMDLIFRTYNSSVKCVIHCASQPSHDLASSMPITDFTINANGTLVLLEAARKHCPAATFIFTSTNKVYGDAPNFLPLVETDMRWEYDLDKIESLGLTDIVSFEGITEKLSIDNSTHSLFGASKVAADVMVQEYGKYFGMNTMVMRGGCLTGPAHKGAELHGFLAYLMQCAISGKQYNIFGYKGKQVRDNIHSYDLVNAFWHFHQNPQPDGQVYNLGGSRFSNCSMMEAIKMCEDITGNKMKTVYVDDNRIGDHICYISDVRKFQAHYPEWKYTKNINDIFVDIYNAKH